MNEAAAKMLRGEGNGRNSLQHSDNVASSYGATRKQTNTAPTQSASSGVKIGGHFQSNAMLMMAPNPVYGQGQGHPMMGQPPMYQPMMVPMNNGYQMMPPGFYPMPPMGYQPGANLPMSNLYAMQQGAGGYPAGGNPINGTKSASNYFSQQEEDMNNQAHRRHGKTDQGDFKVC